MSLSCVLILPLEHVATGNAVGEAMGWGPENYSVPLSVGGAAPATHKGLHAWVADDFQTLIEGGVYPPELADVGVTQAEYDAMVGALTHSFRADAAGHFNAVCAANDLQMVVGW